MQPRGPGRSGKFWWRAAEPIPARPEPLEAHDAGEAAPQPPSPVDARPPRAEAVAAPASGSAGHRHSPARRDLGAYRPRASHGDARADLETEERHDGADAGTRAWTLSSGNSRGPADIRNGASRRVTRALLAASVAGAAIFVATTGFGRHVRPATTIGQEIDSLLIASGYGINEIALAGHRQSLEGDIFGAIGAQGRTLLSLDVRAARRRVEALPWVAEASIVRVLPDKLRVTLREREPKAIWLDGDRTALIDASGRVLTYLASFTPPDLPRLAGEGAPDAATEILTALAAFPEIGQRVAVARRIGGRRWDIELSSGSKVRLAAEDVSGSLARLVRLNRETAVIDAPGRLVDLTVAETIAVSALATGLRIEPERAASGSGRL